MQDVAGLRHLHHEGGLATRQVVAGADAGEDTVDRPDHRTRCRDETADVGQQHDQRVLPHVGRLAAHVRAGDHQHAPAFVQHQIVGLERFLAHRLDHRVPSALDAQAGRFVQFRLRPVQFLCTFGEGGEHVQFAQRGSAALERLEARIERIQQCVVQQLLAGQRTLACRQHLVLELLELFGDVALGAGQCLPARVVHRRLVGLALADLDVVAMHAVVAHLERGDAAARAFAGLQIDQELVRVRAQPAQLVEFGIVAVGQHAAVAELQRRLRGDGGDEQRRGVRVLAQLRRQRPQARRIQRCEMPLHLRQQRQAIAQRGQVARARRA